MENIEGEKINEVNNNRGKRKIYSENKKVLNILGNYLPKRRSLLFLVVHI